MAMGAAGASYKGNGRVKPYGVMLLLAFGAALLGVTIIHKLRERRIFNLLIKEKETQLASLHLLLQKEKEYAKEMKKKTEEMKAKIYSLRNQKMESERRILEMRSTINSLKDERKIIESALEEKQLEIKMHRETRMYPEKQDSQMIGLMESLKQKEAEIEYLKQRIDNPQRILSVSADDSNTQLNSNATGNSADEDKPEGGQLHESTNYHSSGNSARGNGRGMRRSENPHEGFRNNGAFRKEAIDTNEGNRTEGYYQEVNTTSEIVDTVKDVPQRGNADTKSDYREEHKVARDQQLEHRNSQQEKGQDQENFKGDVKLEMNTATSTSSRAKEKHAKGKRWRILARNRRLGSNRNYEYNGAEGMRKGKFSHNDQDEQRDREEVKTSKGKEYGKEMMGVNNPSKATKAEDFSDANPEGTIDIKTKPYLDDANHLERLHGISKGSQISQNGLGLMNESLESNANDIRSKTKKESLYEVDQNKGQDNTRIKEGRNMNIENVGEKANAAKEQERQKETEAADKDSETDTATFDLYKESFFDLEEDREEDTEERDEPEF